MVEPAAVDVVAGPTVDAPGRPETNRRGRWSLTRSSDGGAFLETFLVCGVAAAIGVRAFLAATGYPSVGGSELHIAHMLYGGLLMLAAQVALLLFLGRGAHHVAAAIGGIGFGIFVDEIGKFLTRDNDYFFQPAIAIIYVIFVALFLLVRVVLSAPMLDRRASLANAMDVLEDGLDGTIDPGARGHALALLAQAPPGRLTDSLRDIATHAAARPAPFAWLQLASEWVGRTYDRAVANHLFQAAVIGGMTVYAVGSVAGVAALVWSQGRSMTDEATTAQAIATLAGSALVLRGVIELPRSRTGAYRWFQRGILVWILLAQVFIFYSSQLAGLAGLGVDLLAYAVVRYMLGREGAALASGR